MIECRVSPTRGAISSRKKNARILLKVLVFQQFVAAKAFKTGRPALQCSEAAVPGRGDRMAGKAFLSQVESAPPPDVEIADEPERGPSLEAPATIWSSTSPASTAPRSACWATSSTCRIRGSPRSSKRSGPGVRHLRPASALAPPARRTTPARSRLSAAIPAGVVRVRVELSTWQRRQIRPRVPGRRWGDLGGGPGSFEPSGSGTTPPISRCAGRRSARAIIRPGSAWRRSAKRPSVALILGLSRVGQVVPLGDRHPPDQPGAPQARDPDPRREQGAVGADLPGAPRAGHRLRGRAGQRRRGRSPR